MSLTFYIGQRVRVECPECPIHGCEATIWNLSKLPWGGGSRSIGVEPDELGYQIDVDGIDRMWPNGGFIASPSRFLRPLTPPEQKITWAECPWAPDKIREQVNA